MRLTSRMTSRTRHYICEHTCICKIIVNLKKWAEKLVCYLSITASKYFLENITFHFIDVVACSGRGESAFYESSSTSPLSDFRYHPYQPSLYETSLRTPGPQDASKYQEMLGEEYLSSIPEPDCSNNHVFSSLTHHPPLINSNVSSPIAANSSSYTTEHSALLTDQVLVSSTSGAKAITSQPSISTGIGSKPSTSSIKISKTFRSGRSVAKARSSRTPQHKTKFKGMDPKNMQFRYTRKFKKYFGRQLETIL